MEALPLASLSPPYVAVVAAYCMFIGIVRVVTVLLRHSRHGRQPEAGGYNYRKLGLSLPNKRVSRVVSLLEHMLARLTTLIIDF